MTVTQISLYYHERGLWKFASVAATCDRNQVESVPFVFFVCLFFFSQRCVKIKRAMTKRVPWILYKVIILRFSLLNDVVNWAVYYMYLWMSVRPEFLFFFLLLLSKCWTRKKRNTMWYYLLFSAIILLSQKQKHICLSKVQLKWQ